MSAYRDSLETLLAFYADEHLGDRFGKVRYVNGFWTNPHRGRDINGHPIGTWIPSLIGGSVVRSEQQRVLGHVVTIAGGGPWAGRMMSVCHLHTAGPPIGTNINFAQGIGPLGNSGSMTTGAHVHLVSITDATTNPATSPVENPDFLIVNARSLAQRELVRIASGNVTPINPEEPPPEPLPPLEKRKNDMATVYWVTTTESRTLYALAGDSPGTDANWLESYDANVAASWVDAHGGPTRLNIPSFNEFRAAYRQRVRMTSS